MLPSGFRTFLQLSALGHLAKEAEGSKGKSFLHINTSHTHTEPYVFMEFWWHVVLVFQFKAERRQQQESLGEPASRLQKLRDRDSVTRFDREVSLPTAGHVIQASRELKDSAFQQLDPDSADRDEGHLTLRSRVKFHEAAPSVSPTMR